MLLFGCLGCINGIGKASSARNNNEKEEGIGIAVFSVIFLAIPGFFICAAVANASENNLLTEPTMQIQEVHNR